LLQTRAANHLLDREPVLAETQAAPCLGGRISSPLSEVAAAFNKRNPRQDQLPGVYGLARPVAYIGDMFRWRVSIFGKSARSLGSIIAPDDETMARAKAIEYFHIEPAHHFRVVVTKVEKVKERAKAS
jgi:hypothetical protein